MDFATLLEAALLGVVEGLTEFLPVSSTGHLILLVDLLAFAGPPGRVFEVVIQLGAILAVCVAYASRLWAVVRGLPHDPAALRFARNILVAFLPAAVLGATLHGFIKSVLFDPRVVAMALIVGGFVLLWADRREHAQHYRSVEGIPWRRALGIGLFQTLAMVPGVSRSGATIVGALLLGVERRTAAEFSFFLAIPTMVGASVFDLWKNRETLSAEGLGVIAVGFGVAFLAALLVVRPFVAFVGRHGFGVFGLYRIALGSVILLALLAG